MTTTTTKNWAHSIVTRTDSNFKKRMHPPSNEVDETGAYYTELSQKEKHQYSILMHIYGI